MTPSSSSKSGARGDDFALSPVPARHQGPGTGSLFGVMLGIPSALVFFAVGGGLGQRYGTMALLTGLVVAAVIIGSAGWILTSFAARSRLDSDLMSIRAGFGVRGSALTSAIYSVNFVVLFALEAEIVASAVHAELPSLPRAAVLIVAGLAIVLVAWLGIAVIAPAMAVTLPAFVVLIVWACVDASRAPAPKGSFWSLAPSTGTLSATAWLSALAVLLAFVVNATVAADVGRFLKPERRRLGAFLFGVVLQVACFGGATLLGAWLTFRLGGDSNPGAYLPALLGGWGVVCVLLSQGRINLINAYSGSLSLSNLGARGLGVRLPRQTWMMLLVVVSTSLAMAHISEHLLSILTFEAVFVMAWVFALVAYIVWLEPATSGNLDDAPSFELVGLGALGVSLIVATPLAFGAAGDLGKALAPLVAMLVSPASVLGLGRVSRNRVRHERAHSRSY